MSTCTDGILDVYVVYEDKCWGLSVVSLETVEFQILNVLSFFFECSHLLLYNKPTSTFTKELRLTETAVVVASNVDDYRGVHGSEKIVGNAEIATRARAYYACRVSRLAG